MQIPLVKWLESRAFFVKFAGLFFLIVSGLVLIASLFSKVSEIGDPQLRLIFYILLGVCALAISHFIAYLRGTRNASLKKEDEIRKLRNTLSEFKSAASDMEKLQRHNELLQKEIERKKEAYHRLRQEIKNIKSEEDRQALEKQWEEIKDTYEMTLEKIQGQTVSFSEEATERMKLLAVQTNELLKKGADQAKKHAAILTIFKRKKDSKEELHP